MDFKTKKDINRVMKFSFVFFSLFFSLSHHIEENFKEKNKSIALEASDMVFYEKEGVEEYIEDKMGIEIEFEDSVQIVKSFEGYKEVAPKEYSIIKMARDENKDVSDLSEKDLKSISRYSGINYDWENNRYEDIFFVKNDFLMTVGYSPELDRYALKTIEINNVSEEIIKKIKNDSESNVMGVKDILIIKENKTNDSYTLKYNSNQLDSQLYRFVKNALTSSEYYFLPMVNIFLSFFAAMFFVPLLGREKKRNNSELGMVKSNFFNFKQKKKNNNLLKEKIEESKIIRQKKKKSIKEVQREEIKTTIDND